MMMFLVQYKKRQVTKCFSSGITFFCCGQRIIIIPWISLKISLMANQLMDALPCWCFSKQIVFCAIWHYSSSIRWSTGWCYKDKIWRCCPFFLDWSCLAQLVLLSWIWCKGKSDPIGITYFDSIPAVILCGNKQYQSYCLYFLSLTFIDEIWSLCPLFQVVPFHLRPRLAFSHLLSCPALIIHHKLAARCPC